MAGSGMPCAKMVVAGERAAYACEGNGLRQEVQWRQLDNTTWEVRTLTKSSTVGVPPPPAGALGASAEILAAMDADIRTAQGEELAALKRAREQVAAAGRGASPPIPPTNTVQRYTRVAERCGPAR
jgi:hypothetical protein